MALCRSCGTENEADRDFCKGCGEYMRWDPTGFQAAVPETPAPPPPTPVAGAPPPAPAAGAPPPAPAAPAGAAPGPYQQQAPPPPAIPQQAPVQADTVLVALRLPTDDGYAGEMPKPSVEPGGRTTMIALVRNQSGIVDNYDMAVDGLPEGWWTITPGTVYLVPYGSGGGSYEQEIEVAMHPPRSAEAESRVWDVRVVARSRAYGTEAGGAAASLDVQPFQDIETEIMPERRGGRVRADFKLAVTNRSNSPVDVTFSGVDPESACTFSFHQTPQPKRRAPGVGDAEKAIRQARYLGVGVGPGVGSPEMMANRMMMQFAQGNLGPLTRLLRKRKLPPEIGGMHLDPGEREEAIVSVSPPKQLWIGRPVPHPFQVLVQPAGTDTPAPPRSGTFFHKPWFPWWLVIVVPLLILLILFLLSQRTETVTVPDLAGAADTAAAKSTLDDAKLALGETVEVTNDQAKAGSVIGQEPEAGKKVDAGTEVSIRVAVGSGKVAMPDVKGQTFAQASAAITAAGLTVGPQTPAVTDPNKDVVKDTIPPAGTQAATGSPVQVFLQVPEQTTSSPTPTDTTGQGTTPPPSPGPTPPVVVPPGPTPPSGDGPKMPDLVGQAQDKAGEAIAKLKLQPQITSAISDEGAAGVVVSQDPAPGAAVKEGQAVKLVVSSGFPSLVVELNSNIVRIKGTDGSSPAKIAASDAVEIEPTASRDGALVVYTRAPAGTDPEKGAQLFRVAGDPNSAQALTTAGFIDGRPALSPDGKVVAFKSNRANPADFDLCFLRLDVANAQPACVADPGTSITRPTWDPSGRTIAVIASDAQQAAVKQTELMLYSSQTPNSANPADWSRQGGFLTDGMHGQEVEDQVTSATFSPDGTKLAFSATWSGAAKVFVLKIQNGQIETKRPDAVPRLTGCEVAYRQDGVELAVTVRDQGCDQTGRIIRVDPARPEQQIALTGVGSSAANPVWVPTPPG